MSDWQDAPPDDYPFEIKGQPEFVTSPPVTFGKVRLVTVQDGSIIPQTGRDENERES